MYCGISEIGLLEKILHKLMALCMAAVTLVHQQ